jgi:hypothetical protein
MNKMKKENLVTNLIIGGMIWTSMNFGAFSGTISYRNYEMAKEATDTIKKYLPPLYYATYPGVQLGLEYRKENPMYGPVTWR